MNQQNLSSKNFIIIALGQFISLFGNSLQRFALSLYILDLTGSAAIFSTILSISVLPQILLAPFGGAFADRFSKKKIMVYLDTFSGLFLLAFCIYLNYFTNKSVIPIAFLMCGLTIIQSIYEPSVRASVPAIISSELLTQANSIISVISSISSLLGPIAAGFVYGILGIQAVFYINIISFFISALMELFLHIPHTPKKINGSILRTFLGDLKQTFHFLYHEKKPILYIILISASFNLFLTPIYIVGMPYMEKIIFRISNQLYGISEGFVGAGMIVGALLTGVVSKKYPFQKINVYFYGVILATLLMGLCATPVLLSKTGTSFVAYVFFTITGILFAILLSMVNILCMTYMQQEIPMEYMGKTMSVVMSLSMALMPIGQVIFGGLYDIFRNYCWIIYLFVAILSGIVTYITKRLLIMIYGK